MARNNLQRREQRRAAVVMGRTAHDHPVLSFLLPVIIVVVMS
jgi:hypothetical protein